MKKKQIKKTLEGKTGKDLLNLIDSKAKHNVKPDAVAPVGEIENTLFDFWKSLLGHDNFGVNDDFFQIGGNSIKAIQLLSRMSSQFSVQLQTTEIFLQPTIKQLASLIRIRQNELQDHQPFNLIGKKERPSFIPLSFSQERLWFIDRLEGSLPYHLSSVLSLKGKLDIKALEHSIGAVINRHEALRTVINEKDGHAFQKVKEKDDWKLTEVDGLKYKDDRESLQKFIESLTNEPFDLSKDDMLRCHLIMLGEQDHELVVTIHHIASDAWSMPIIVNEVAEFYNAYLEDRPAKLEDLPLQYSDYALWQREYMKGDVLDKKLDYWKEKLEGVSPLALPTDYPRPLVKGIRGTSKVFSIDKDLLDGIHKLNREYGTTLFMTLLAVFKVLMHRYSGQQDISAGASIVNRPQKELEGLIGYFVNTLALRSEVNSDKSFADLLHQVKNTTLEAYEHQDVPFERVVEAVAKERDSSRSPLFQVLLVLNNTPEISKLRLGEMELTAEAFENNISKFDLSFHFLETAEGLQGSAEYSTDLFIEETIDRMTGHFRELIRSATEDPHQQIGKLQMLTKPEENQLLKVFGFSETDYPRDKTVSELFESQAKKTPGATAIVFEGKHLTYKQLNESSNRLAHYLRSKGVKEETPVPLCIERGLDMIVGLLAIMKAGGAYVPIDTDLPHERIGNILDDTKSSIVISSKQCRSKIPKIKGIEIIETDGDRSAINIQPSGDLGTKPDSNDLAYVIYTSGSTGKPKGVMIGHRNIVDYVFGLDKKIQINECRSFALVSTIATDLGNTVIYSSLLSGGTLHLFSKESVSSIEFIHNYFKEHRIECVKIVPSHWKALCTKEDLLLPAKLLVFGGEALHSELAERIRQSGSECKIVNHYGPTETTIGKLHQVIDPDQRYGNTIPIGRPFSNTGVYVLSKELELCPIGVAGELYIAGEGLARGYLNNSELTKKKFIKNPFHSDESLMYATGDLVRYLQDGSIEFLGRADDQVKIRGYRIELGEIEGALQQNEKISEAVVLAREDKPGNKRLVAYIVSDKEFSREEITSYLKERLPEYMVPALFVELDSLPLTANGKIDRKSLPDPDVSEIQSKEFAAPRNEAEKILTEIWQELLDLDTVGIHDNFFELGGDSIVTIQLVSRARRAGFELQVGDVFAYQTIARLSALLDQRSEKQSDATGEQFVLSGPSGLLPIQQWFFDKDHGKSERKISHFNQSVLLGVNKGVNESVLKRAFEQLTEHHDGLRFKYYKKEDEWNQVYEAEPEISEVLVLDLQNAKEESPESLISKHVGRYQESLDIEKGELVRVVLMRTPASEKLNRLLIIVHHLAIDGVSWRILLEDLELIVNGLINAGTTELGSKSSSYRQWYETLQKYGKSERLISQKKYWTTIPKINKTHKIEESEDIIRIKDIAHNTMRLSSAQTQKLLQEVPRVYHTEINDILLSALAKTLCQWSGEKNAVIEMEGHGREMIREAVEDGIDLSRTTGWFTSHYPVSLDLNNAESKDALIKSVKEQLRKVPDKGLGYGVLKYINKEEAFLNSASPDIKFNYLGQSDNVLGSSQWFTLAGESSGENASDEEPVSNKITMNGLIKDGELNIDWSYSSRHFDKKTITKLVRVYQSNLESLIAHCLEQEKSGAVFTPSDFGFGSEISYSELDKFLNESFADKPRIESLEGLYRLSGLQQGMLFHELYDCETGTYIRQLGCNLLNVNIDTFKRSWDFVIKNHSALRSGFYPDDFSIPVQCVYKEVELPLEVLDFGNLNSAEQTAAINNYKASDRLKGFDFRSAPLMRIGLMRLSDDSYRMLWTWHHILFDGWSMQILMEEFLRTYETLLSANEPVTKADDRYEDYIGYLEKKDREKEETYWNNYLDGLEQSTSLPYTETTAERNMEAGLYESAALQLDETVTERIHSYAKRNHLTINTIIQGVWSVILHQYTGSSDIAFGVVVSGRPDDLQGVEQRVGMFINTLPLRSRFICHQSILQWLQNIQSEQVASRQHQYTPLQDIQKLSRVSGHLFDSLLVFENYPLSKITGSKKWSLGIEDAGMQEQTNYPLAISIDSGAKQIDINFGYNTNILKTENVNEMRGHFENVLHQFISNEKGNLNEINLLTETESKQILAEFNDSAAEYPKDKSLAELFEEQAARTPDRTALIFEDHEITYRELNERSNRLANYLIEKGIRPGENVGLLSLRGFDMITGIIGILKSGCAYVPFNTEYPLERLEYIIEDTNIKHIVSTDKDLITECGLEKYDFIDIKDSYSSSAKSTGIKSDIDSCVYVMFTSGTTGRPKGIAVSHRNVIKLVYDTGDISVKPDDRVLQWSSYSFDGSTYDIYSSLLKGASLCLIKDSWASNADELTRTIEEKNITICFITTALFNAFIETQPNALKGLRKILFGGEMVSQFHVRKALSVLGTGKIVHVYGPTETTVYATGYPVNSVGEDGIIPIGKPLSNTSLFVLNEYGKPVPVGVEGELFIGGDGVSMGYVKNDELTREKFVDNPFNKNKNDRLYRTGDIVRWLPGGCIEYLGRKDSQVKIRGFRIELGEIESVLQECKSVRQAAVLAGSNKDGNKRLVGYVVPKDVFDKEAITTFLGKKLPEFMIPAIWVVMESLPLNKNGKIDRKALPEPDASELLNNEYAEPRNGTEENLAAIWKELLRTERAGINDNFFELGGDSIITIQVVSRARKLGYDLKPKDIFIHQTISNLSVLIKERSKAKVTGEQGLLTGTSGLLPIQQWYLEGAGPDVSHFNQSVLLSINKTITPESLEVAFERLILHHDALRFRYNKVDGNWIQEYGNETDVTNILAEVDLQKSKRDLLAGLIKKQCEMYQQSLDIEKGDLMRAVLILTPGSEKANRLLITVHHLAIDGVSWRILLEDLEQLLSALSVSGKTELSLLGHKSSSFRQWYDELRKYGQSKRLNSQSEYWKSVVSETLTLPVDKKFEGDVFEKDRHQYTVILKEEKTKQLLQEVPRVYHTEINDILLSALAQTLLEWSGRSTVFGLEGHGREDLINETDISRTVGWFTSLYPVFLQIDLDMKSGDLIKSVKEQLRQIPDKGLGFGVLKYINKEEPLQKASGWDIVFNYLGQLDNAAGESKWISKANEPGGSDISPEFKTGTKISVNSYIQDGKLILNWNYSSKHFKKNTMVEIAEKYLMILESLITHCIEQQKSGAVHTPSDYGLGSEVSYEELDEFLQTDDKDNIMSF